MADSEPVQFLDIISTLPGAQKSWSPNTLKVRAVLNFKAIPYTQSWISYPDIAPLTKGLGLGPNEVGIPYTLPVIIHKSVTSNPHGAMMDSLPIVMHLDKAFPSRPLFPSGDASYALLVAVSKIASGMGPAVRSLIIPRVADYMDPRGKEYFTETRSKFFGKPLSEVRPTDQGTIDELWKQVEIEAGPLVKMLKGREGKKGPFFEGETPGYVDLYLACQFAFFERIDREAFDRLMAIGNGEFKALWEACEPWIDGQGEEKEWTGPKTAA
ncbi:Glutathione S-transferase-like protein ustS [Penicillium cataractarum]|uniref:Glutathione S-transferase-like protein ustS n=1 Tax=Penicillium cataractarum TaxID=2100454 RepID=A0A9W9SFJ8_9EURO|nr:Glutathione S-transferase-like protein ustS [Penicillium cataractarum]KAJ5377703.1 Glutathione S-transferase-like protein ustS [Penicillium cataractarum]